MSFVYKVEPKETPKPRQSRGPLPVETLRQMGCKACPRDKADLKRGKMMPEGPQSSPIYLLSNRPTVIEDGSGCWTGIAAREILSKFRGRQNQRMGHIVQCAPADSEGHKHPDGAEVECCRGRVVSDIELVQPKVVVGVGDEPLYWATGLRNSNTFRGTLIATRIGRHACWYYPILYPAYTAKAARRSQSEIEYTTQHDISEIERLVDRDELPRLQVCAPPYDGGIICITGQEPGDMQRLEDELHAMLRLKHLGLDLETSTIRPRLVLEPKIWTAAVGTFERTIAFPLEHPDGWGAESRIAKAKGLLGEFLLQSGRKRCHNLAFEQEWLALEYGPQVLRRTEWDDTMAMAHVMDSRKGTKSLDVQCRVNFGFFLKDQSRVDVSRPNWIAEFPIKEVLRYNAMDAKWTDRLGDVLLARMVGPDEKVYEDKVRVCPTLVLTSARGLPIDMVYAQDMVAKIGKKLSALERAAARFPEVQKYEREFGRFSFTNPDHVLTLMDKVLRRPEVRQEDIDGSVRMTTDEEALESMPPDEVPIAGMIVEHRGLTRCVTTYLQPLLEGKLAGPDGMIHAQYSALHTVTGRLNSEMHNWPKHKHREVRGAVVALEGHWLVAADYGQIEFRVAGMLTGDDNIIKYSWTGYDVHKFWAERIVREYPRIKDRIVKEYAIDWDEKGLKTLRQETKNGWVFPQLFGSTTRSCAAGMRIPEDVADDLGAEFWDEFRGAKRWQENLLRGWQKYNYVETMGGFRRRGPDTRNKLINMPIQGTACEIVLEAMNALSERSDAEGDPNIQPAFNGHDDLTFVVADAVLERSIAVISREMCQHRFSYINVPLKVEVSVGPRWHELEEIAVYSSEDLFNLRNPYK